jgi:ElaB/YqjD/DUF883 family membrane-anchored ribosome-binding protein
MQVSSNVVSPAGGSNYAMKTGSVEQDGQIKALQKQIENLQKQLQNISEDKNMSSEMKMERRKEIQQQIQDLNMQISQRKMEIQREKCEAVKNDKEIHSDNTAKEDSVTIGTVTMQGLISADTSMKHVNNVQAVKTTMKGKTGVLKSEIEIDKSRGISPERKVAELADLNNRIDTATNNMMERISDINVELEKTAGTSDEQEKIENDQGKEGSEDNEVGSFNVHEQKNNRDKPVIYTKDGTSNEQELEPEPEVSVRI